MNICFIATTPYPGVTFPELRNAAAELAKLSHAVTVIAAHQAGESFHEVHQNIAVTRLPIQNRWQTETFFWRAACYARKIQPDIIHVFWRFGAGLVPFITGRRKCLLDIRTGSIDERSWRRRLENIFLRVDQRCYRYSTTLDEPLAKHLGVKVDGYVPEGIPQQLLEDRRVEAKNAIRKQAGWRNDEVVGIYIGTAYLRHLEQLMEGWMLARKRLHRIRLVIIGDAIDMPNLRALASASNNTIELHPKQPPEKIWPLLRAADFGIAYVPNSPGFAYQQSTKILEYLAAKLPVLATKTPANIRFVHDTKNGILTEDSTEGVRKGLERMLQSLHEISGDNLDATSLLRTYAWERIVRDRLLPMYNAIV